MSFPLIQLPSPLQELAQTVRGIKGRREAEETRRLEMQVRRAQLASEGAQQKAQKRRAELVPLEAEYLKAQTRAQTALAQQREAEARPADLAAWLPLVPERMRGALTLVSLMDPRLFPAEVRNQAFNAMVPGGQAFTGESATLFSSLFRTGAMTIGEAAQISGFPLSPEVRRDLKVPRNLATADEALAARIRRLQSVVSASNTYTDNVRADENRILEANRRRIGGFAYTRGTPLTQMQENRAVQATERAMNRRYPDRERVRQRAEEATREISTAVLGQEATPPPSAAPVQASEEVREQWSRAYDRIRARGRRP